MDANDYSFGMDIVSLTIQRSRDHGIPSYTQFRKYCGLKDIETVEDLSEIMVEGVSLKKNMKLLNNSLINVLVTFFLHIVFSQLINY